MSLPRVLALSMLTLLTLAASTAGSAGLVGAARPPVNLGSLLEPGVSCFAVAVNDRGQVVGMAWDPQDPFGRGYPVVWEKGAVGFEAIALGTLDGPTWYDLSIPDNGLGPQRAINRESQIVGYSHGALRRPVIWRQFAPGWANPALLWPPNHKMVNVTVEYAASDESGSVDCALGPVTSNETLTASGWTILGAHHVELISERAGAGLGRTYSIPITCVDPSGNTATEPVIVTVPHDRK